MSERGVPDEYYRAIEAEFVRRRGAPLLLSPRDWSLIGEWRATGIPLRIVLQGIANVFDAFERRRHAGGRRVNSLSYCRQEVLSIYDLYTALRSAEAGRPGPQGTGGAHVVLRHLGRLSRRVREAMGAASEARFDPLVASLARAASDLRRLRKQVKDNSLHPQGLDDHLRDLDVSILAAAHASLAAEEIRAMEDGVESDLQALRGRMTTEAFDITRRAHLARHLRLRCGLPRLTLFD
jgi:hypothetical protein